MELSARAASVEEIWPFRDLYRQEMNCQIVHDSLHSRKGWTQSYLLTIDGAAAGYGAVAVGGPWKGKPALFEFYVLPQQRSRVFDLFEALLTTSGVELIDVQSNDPLLTAMAHAFARTVASESILFHDRLTTGHSLPGVVFRQATPADAEHIRLHDLDSSANWVLESEGTVVAAGDILFHYNRPYGDIYMKVAEFYRKRGLGSYLVQELKRICYEQGNIPSARCNPKNIASRKTLQKAGFVPCGHILNVTVSI